MVRRCHVGQVAKGGYERTEDLKRDKENGFKTLYQPKYPHAWVKEWTVKFSMGECGPSQMSRKIQGFESSRNLGLEKGRNSERGIVDQGIEHHRKTTNTAGNQRNVSVCQ